MEPDSQASTIGALLSAAASEAPRRVALTTVTHDPVSYAELEGHIARAGGGLRSLGIRRGDRVAIAMPDGPELAQTFVSVTTHAVAAPLNPALPRAELERALHDVRARLLLVEADNLASVSEVAERAGIRVVDAAAILGAEPIRSSREPAGPDDVALILSTSGTTSQPKLIPLTHANLCASAGNIARHLRLTSEDRCLSVMPLFHVHGLVGGLLASLAAGASVVSAPPFDPRATVDWLEELQPTWYTAVPAMHQALLDAAGTTPRRTSLRFIRSSSSPMPARLASELERVFGVPLIESYGMTEAAHQITSNPLPPAPRKPGTVGLAAGPEIAIVGGDGARKLPGERGEIVIRGVNVTRGYLADPVVNDAAFTSDGWLRTGDEGVLDEDGYLRICGRLKEVINRGGESVSPLEVDEVLLDHPAVLQAVTFAVPHGRLGEDVAAAIVIRPGATATAPELRAFAATRLAPSKVPHRVLLVEELPRGQTGKVQRIGLGDALGLEDGRRLARRPKAASARTPIEAELADRWATVLEIGGVDVDEDFFDLGGDSLAAAQLLAFVDEAYGVELPLGSLLDEAATVAGMARLVEDHRAWLRASRAEVPELEILRLHSDGAENPLFIIDPTLALLRRLTQRVGGSRPIAELLMPVAHDAFTAFTSVEAMAAYYATVIRTVQPEGPYFVGGHSFAGLVAFDLARQLAGRGEPIGLLFMLDTVCPTVRDLEPSLPLRLHLRRARSRDRGRLAYLRSVRTQRREGSVRPGQRVLMAARYVPGRLGVPTMLLSTRANVEEYSDPTLGWGEFTTKLETHEVPGDHRSMLGEPHALDLAAAIASRLERAGTARRASASDGR